MSIIQNRDEHESAKDSLDIIHEILHQIKEIAKVLFSRNGPFERWTSACEDDVNIEELNDVLYWITFILPEKGKKYVIFGSASKPFKFLKIK